MRAADPVHNVELRRNAQGHDSVVFAFPYRAEIVSAVRAVPGRRFDWETKEWWAPRADAVAPFVKGVLERHPSLSVSPEVVEWLSRAVTGWIGRVTAGRLDGAGHFSLETIAGELEPPLAGQASERGGRLWLPFTQEVADELLEMKGARLDPRALRCASRLQHVLDARALERAQLPPQHRLDRQRRRRGGTRAAHVADRGVVLAAQAVQHLERVGGGRHAVGAQVVLERLEQVRVDRHGAAVRLAGGQGEERRQHVRVPVDVQLEARLAVALDQRQRGGRGRLVDLQS